MLDGFRISFLAIGLVYLITDAQLCLHAVTPSILVFVYMPFSSCSILYIHHSGEMRGVISLFLFFLGAITSLIGQVSHPAGTLFLKLFIYSCTDRFRITLVEKIASRFFTSFLYGCFVAINLHTVKEKY